MTPATPPPFPEQQSPPAAQLPESKSALTAFAFAEYQRLRREGLAPDIHEWCALFPTCRSSLQKVLEVEALLGSEIDGLVKGSCDESIDWPKGGEQREGFVILRELARGGFARVYLATETATGDRLVVLKCSLVGDAEARTLGRLSHPGIVPVLSARRDESAGLSLVCMPYLGCATLEDVLDHVRGNAPAQATVILEVIRSCDQPEDPPAPPADRRLLQGSYADGVIHLAAQLAQTLAFLHERGICHRDLKPSNVLLDPSGKPLLLDFNLSDSPWEATTPVGGTLRYMAPEQLRAFLEGRSSGMDERADLYALAVMVYELLAGDSAPGDLPADVPAQARILLERRQAGLPSFRRVCPALERPVAALLDSCLALDARDRPGSAGELATGLRRQFTPARRLRRRLTARRHWILAALGLVATAVVALAYAWAVTPSYSQREYDRGRLAYRGGDYEAAQMHFDRAVHADPREPRFRYARGCARLQRSKILPADRADLEQVLSDLTSPEQGEADCQTLAVHAYAHLRRQQLEQAIKLYDRMEKLGDRSAMVLNNRAYACLGLGQWERARVDVADAVGASPHCQAAHYNRALILLHLRRQGKLKVIPPLALEDVEQVLGSGPRTSALYRDAALVYALAADDSSQLAHSERALFFLRQALLAGEEAAAFRSSPALTDALRRPDFAALVSSPAHRASPQPDLRLVDPVQLPD
jgi:tetratricopeptide (TPR) repeat protein